jgi:hypothetical protein
VFIGKIAKNAKIAKIGERLDFSRSWP